MAYALGISVKTIRRHRDQSTCAFGKFVFKGEKTKDTPVNLKSASEVQAIIDSNRVTPRSETFTGGPKIVFVYLDGVLIYKSNSVTQLAYDLGISVKTIRKHLNQPTKVLDKFVLKETEDTPMNLMPPSEIQAIIDANRPTPRSTSSRQPQGTFLYRDGKLVYSTSSISKMSAELGISHRNLQTCRDTFRLLRSTFVVSNIGPNEFIGFKGYDTLTLSEIISILDANKPFSYSNILVTNLETKESFNFSTFREAQEFIGATHSAVWFSINKGKIFANKWRVSSSSKSPRIVNSNDSLLTYLLFISFFPFFLALTTSS